MALLPPHDPEAHEHQEPENAGFMWWAKEVAKLAAWSAVHGELIDGNDAAKMLGVTRQRVSELGNKGTIRRFTAGRHSFYPLADLQAWDERRKSGHVVTGRGHKAQPVFELAV